MKIALFTDTYLPDINGISTAVHNLRINLEKKGHDVYVFAPGSRKLKTECNDPKIIYFTSASFKRYPDFRLALFPFVNAVEVVKNLGIEFIHNHSIATMGLAAIRCMQKLNLPGISSLHKYSYFEKAPEGLGRELALKYFKWFYDHFDKVMVPSDFTLKKLSKIGITSNILPNIVDYEFFSKPSSKKRIYDFIYVGKISKSKDLDTILEHSINIKNVLKKDINILMVGEGGYKQILQERANSKGVSDYFLWTGLLSKKKVRELYWQSKTFLYTSSLDTQSISLIEAMSAGVVPVVPENSWAKQIIKDKENGFVYSDGLDFYRDAVESMEADKDFREKVREKAKEFSPENLIGKYLEIYESLLKKEKSE